MSIFSTDDHEYDVYKKMLLVASKFSLVIETTLDIFALMMTYNCNSTYLRSKLKLYEVCKRVQFSCSINWDANDCISST